MRSSPPGPWRAFSDPATDSRLNAQLAAYAGVAPLEASSAGLVRHRQTGAAIGGSMRFSTVLC